MARKRIYGDQVSDAASAGIDLGDLGSAEVIKIDEIRVDEDYQRELRHDLVNKIAQEYDLVKAGPILVNERKRKDGGGLWAVDGQHRMAGAAQAGEAEILAHVTHGLSKEQEAELRLARNDRRSDNQQEKFRTRLVMGDEKAHAIVELVRQKGTRLNIDSTNVHVGINAIGAAETLYDAGVGNGLWLGKVLDLLREAFGEENMGGRVCSSAMMKSLAWFLDRHHVPKAELIEKLRLAGVDEVDRQARNHKAISGGSMWLNYYRALVGIWNFGRQDANKLDVKIKGSLAQLGTAANPGPHTGGFERTHR
jgi:hypothetical protein